MSHLYIIGPGKNRTGLFAIGLAKDPKERLAALQALQPEAGPFTIMRSYELARGWDNLAATILHRRIGARGNGDGWFRCTSGEALTAVDYAYRATQIGRPETSKRKLAKPPEPAFAETMKALRTQVFGATMEVIATIAGTSASSVSRWEAGELDPGLAEIVRLRAFAHKHGLAWKDAMLFEPQQRGMAP